MKSMFLMLLILLVIAQLTAGEVRSVRSADGVPVVYEVHGRRDSEVTLVLIHGWSNDRTFWEPHISNLVSQFRIVTLDLAGFGESGTNRTDWTIDAFGDDVRAVVEDIGDQKIVLVGFSLGGPVALETALDIPNRISGVVLVDILQDPSAGIPEETRQTIVKSWRDTWGGPDWTAFGNTPPELVGRYLGKVPATPPEHWWTVLDNVFRWLNEQAIPTLKRIEVPVAAVNSDQIPTKVEVLQQYTPSFTLRTMKGVSHLGVIWQDVDVFDQYLTELVLGMTDGHQNAVDK